MMHADRWREISRLYHEARTRPADERGRFLDIACGGDDLLRAEVVALLGGESRAFDGGEHPAHASLDQAVPATPNRSAGDPDRAAADEITVAAPLPMLGTYLVERLLGRGGMGAVYLAFDTRLRRQVALKVMSGPARGARARDQLLREARSAAVLSHPNICAIHEVGDADGAAFIAMEYVEGRSLRERLDAGPLSREEALRFGIQAADALAFAHDRGVVHRDLKAANVIVSTEGRLKVVDFGLARRDDPGLAAGAMATLAPPGAATGTPYAMAPEQVRGEATDARTDVWALGVLLYEMAAGRRPFTAPTIGELFSTILRDPPAPLPDGVASDIRAVILRCLEREPGRRYQHAGDVRSALEAIQAGEAVPAARVRRRGRRGLTATIAATAAAAAIAMAALVDLRQIGPWLEGLLSTDVIAFEERDWLLIADFENFTRDPVFDQALDTALAVGLGQSSYVNVLPASRVDGALQRMKRAADRIDAATAREVAQREGARLVLAPSIAEIGGLYQLTGALEDPQTGAVLGSAVVRARRKDEILPAVDELIAQIRRTLGEASRAISRQGRPLVDVTTASLEALKVFSTAREAYLAARVDEARALFEEALRLDPSFTAARAQLGILNYELRDREAGRRQLEQAIGEIEGLTEREKFSVLAFHAAAVENDPGKAADYYRSLLAMYPDSSPAHNNLGRAYMQMELWDEAIGELTRALELDPYSMLTYNSLNQIYLYRLRDLDAAIALCQRQLTYSDRIPYTYDYLGWALLGKDDLAGARTAFEQALALDPSATLDLFRLGHTYRLEGRFAEARDTFLKVPAIDASDHSAYYDAGVASRLLGDEAAARRHFERSRRMLEAAIREESTAARQLDLAAVLSRLGEAGAAAAAAERGLALDPGQHFEYARFLGLQGRTADAIARLQQAVKEGFRNFVWMKIHADFDTLKAEPAFQALIDEGLNRRTRAAVITYQDRAV